MKGTYILLIEIGKDVKINVGSLGKIKFRKGQYCYVGSGMNNLGKRIQRHLSKEKEIHWHIDYLLESGAVEVKRVYYMDNGKREECEVAYEIGRFGTKIKKFGSSDCKCLSHLFRVGKEFLGWIKNKGWKVMKP